MNVNGFTISIDIAAPAERVWQVMSDVDRWHEWTASVDSVKRIDDRPMAVGTKGIIRQPKFPKALWTVIALDGGSSFTWVSRTPGMRVTGVHSVTTTSAGSRATLALELTGPLSGIFWKLTRRISERYVTLEAQGLKQR